MARHGLTPLTLQLATALLVVACSWLTAPAAAAAAAAAAPHLQASHHTTLTATRATGRPHRRLSQAAGNWTTQLEQVRQFALAAAKVSLTNTRALLTAVQAGDLVAAKAAYVTMRPEYEQIEVLYQVFPDLDQDIDARPYVLTHGDAYKPELISEPASVFQGSHRVEGLLYREGNVSAALTWTQELVRDSQALVDLLEAPEDFTVAKVWHGVIELPFEVAYKKFSSEEETYSDLSVLIFHNNLKGVSSIFQPWQAALRAANATLAARVNATFAAAAATLTPYLSTSVSPFQVNGTTGTTNGTTTTPTTSGTTTYAAYSSVPIKARRAIQLAFYALAEALEQAAEALGIDPSLDAEGPVPECRPSNSIKTYDATSTQVKQGVDYLRALVPYTIKESKAFTQLVEAGDLEAVKAAYLRTRPLYEQIEVLATEFVFQDIALDAREYNIPRGELNSDFQGYHRLERLIFSDGDVGNATLRWARSVETVLADLKATFDDTSASKWTAAKTFDSLMGLATEVVSKKVSSEEETSSDLSLMIFYNNWKGIYSQAAPFCSLAPAACKALTDAVTKAGACLGITTSDVITNVGASLVNDQFVENLLTAKYPAYSAASMSTRACIVREGYGVVNALVYFANALNVLDDCSDFHTKNMIYYPAGVFTVDASSGGGAGAAPSPPPPSGAAAAPPRMSWVAMAACVCLAALLLAWQ